MSLRARVLTLIGLVLIVGVLLGSVLAGYEAKRTLGDELRAGMLSGQQTVLSAFEDLPRSDHAPRDLHQLVATFDGNRHVRASLADGQDKVLESSLRLDPVEPTPLWFIRLLGSPPASIRIPAPPPVLDRAILLQPISDIDTHALWTEFCVVWIALGVAVVAGLIVVYVAIGAALSPLRALSGGFVRVGAGDYGVRVARGGPYELADLQTGFNEMVGRLTDISRRNTALEAQLITLQEEERADLARDLHDEIGPHLFAVNVDAEVIGQLVGADAQGPVAGHIQSIQASVGHMQGLVREILGRLRPSRATELGLIPAITDLVEFWRARAPAIEIECALLVDEAVLDEPIKDTVYRLIQEGLNNAMRHAAASHIAVRLAPQGQREVEVSIVDNGAPDSAAKEGGFGIVGMRERVRASGGTLVIGSRGEQGGWSVNARMPLKATMAETEVER